MGRLLARVVTSPKQVLKASAAGRILLWSDRSLFAVSRFGSTAPTILFLPAQVSFGAMRQSRRLVNTGGFAANPEMTTRRCYPQVYLAGWLCCLSHDDLR